MLELMIIAGGIYTLGFVVFHLCFWKLFKWEQDLQTVSTVNRSIMQVLNISLTVSFLVFSYISLFHSVELLTTEIGKASLVLISVFWLLRAIQQIIFFRLNHCASIGFFFVFLFGFVLYAIPAWYSL